MSKFSIGVLVALLLCALSILWVIYAIRKREEYTREKFAFVALTSFIAFCATIAGSIADKESPWTTVINFIRAVRGLPREPSEPHTADHVLLVLIVGIVAFFIYKVYRNWGGAISLDEHRREQFQSSPALLRDGLDEARRLIHGKPRLVQKFTEAQAMFAPLDIPRDLLAWHLQ